MANISAAAPAAPGEFRIGDVFSKTATLLSRNFLIFFVVALVAALPHLLLFGIERTGGTFPFARFSIAMLLSFVLGPLAQAVLLYGAFQAMRGRPVNLGECLSVGLSRFFAIIGLTMCFLIAIVLVFAVPTVLINLVARLLGFVGPLLSTILGILTGAGLAAWLFTTWYVATPVCVVEQKGPLASLGRSSEITNGHRWKIFGMLLLIFIVLGIVGAVIGGLLGVIGSAVLAALGNLLWSGVWGAFYAIFGVVTYHDLRVAKEGVDTDQIASVFD
jgi:hypothetical protein